MSNPAVSPRSSTQVGIDAKNEVGSPVDFSFKNLTAFDDVEDEEPRKKTNHKAMKKNSNNKYDSTALKFNNNTLTDVNGLDAVVQLLLAKPQELAWLDISMNDISKVDDVLLNFPNIKMLYLHGNSIMNLAEIDKLAKLPNLITLTLHGNPIDSQKGYRQYVLAKLPALRTLDFSRVTKADRMDAVTWEKMFGRKKHTRKKTED